MSFLPHGLTPVAFSPPGVVNVLALPASPVSGTWEESVFIRLTLPASVTLLSEMVVGEGTFGAEPVDLLVGAFRSGPLPLLILLSPVLVLESGSLPGVVSVLLLGDPDIHHDGLEVGQLRLYQQ